MVKVVGGEERFRPASMLYRDIKNEAGELERWLSSQEPFSIGPVLDCKHPHGNSQLSVTLLSKDLVPSSGIHRLYTHIVHRQTNIQAKPSRT